MKNPIRLILIAVGLALTLVGQALAQKESKKSGRMDTFMRQKLAYSQLILEGLTLEKYGLIVTNGQRLWNMGRDNLWQQVDTEEYRQQSQKFRDNVLALIEAGRDKKLDAAREAYAKTLQSCYDCHKYFKIVERAKLPPKRKYE
jgi:hypothetical protein